MTSEQPLPAELALSGADGRSVRLGEPGLRRLALMVGTVLERLTAVEDPPARGS